MEHAAQFRSLRAPQQDGQRLIDPPYPALPDLVAANRELLAGVDYDVHGRSLTDLAATGRRELVARAVAYTRQYRNVPARYENLAGLAAAPVILSGHQPQLFHPGVWYKNFVLGQLAGELEGTGIHLLIDSDLCRSVSVRVPTGTAEQPRVEAVPYDKPSAEVPYEECPIRDPDVLASYAQRMVGLIQPFVEHPLVESLWPLTLERNPAELNLGLRLAQGRHALEATFGNETLELPQSAVCQLPEFAWFTAHVLAHLPRFWLAHNDSLTAYRQAHGLRNRAQPVPDLGAEDGWLEAPFWIWTTDDPRRRPLFAEQQSDRLIITDRHRHTFSLALSDDADATAAVDQLLDIAARGVKIRTRALSTTLFSRLVLGDLFLHGIGGAKYDQVTDQIIRRFFGVAPPEFATVSATLRLPIPHPQAAAHDGRHWQQRWRELRYHPENYVSPGGKSSSEIIATKRRWVETAKTAANARERHVAITSANDALQPFVAHRRQQLEQEREEILRGERARAILDSREYSFCLFPRQHFERLLRDDTPPDNSV